MAKKHTPKALAAAIGATFVASMAASPVVNADQNPFAMSPLSSGYQVAGKDGNCGEGKCGGMKKGETMKKGAKMKKDGSCGGMKKGAKMKKDGSCGGKKKGAKMKKDGSCGGKK